MTTSKSEMTYENHARDGNGQVHYVEGSEKSSDVQEGCYMSKKKGLLLLIVFLGVATAVGVIVYYVTKDRIITDPVSCPKVTDSRPPFQATTSLPPTKRVTDVRLPGNIIPYHYNVELKPDFYTGNPETFFFTGNTEIFVRCVQSTRNVILHAKKLNISSVEVEIIQAENGSTSDSSTTSGEMIRVVSVNDDLAREWIKISVDKDLMSGRNYKLKFIFNASITDSLNGLYRSSYKDRNNATKWLVTSDLEPTDARKILPCFDEPAMKATFSITLLAKQGVKALSNMPVLTTVDVDDGEWQRYTFQKSANMSTYLLAFIISDFRYKSGKTRNQQEFRVYCRPEARNQADYALSTGIKMHDYFEDFFNISYALPKQVPLRDQLYHSFRAVLIGIILTLLTVCIRAILVACDPFSPQYQLHSVIFCEFCINYRVLNVDLIAIPDFASGAMENWGLVTFRETALLYDPQTSSVANQQRVATVISHELAHQWFGNLVSPAWWDDLWLNEGFASYVEYLGVEHAEPRWEMMDIFLLDDLHRALSLDSIGSSHPIYQPVNNPEEIREIFDAITYSKGASVIRMMHSFLGDRTFRKGLTRYLLRHQYSNANHNDLWAALAEQSRIDGTAVDVEGVMNSWIKQMGYPLVTVRRVNDSSNLQISQQHFLLHPICPHHPIEPSPYGYRWKVQFTYTFGSSLNWENPYKYWMNDTSKSEAIELPVSLTTDDWVIGNVGQSGYYRVNYDNENWEKLARELLRNYLIIQVKNRAQILDDSFYIWRAGIINYETAMNLAKYLINETEYLPWKAIARHLYYIQTMLERTDVFGDYQEHVRRLIKPLYEKFTRTASVPGERHTQRLLRNLAIELACNFDHQPCLNKMRDLYRSWMNSPQQNTIDTELRGKVYCHAIRQGGLAEWEFAYRQYQASTQAVEKDRLLAAMSCSGQPWILSRYINLAWKSLPKQDTIYTLARISTEPAGRSLVWNYFRQNFIEIKKRYGEASFMLGNLFGSLTKAFNTDIEHKELKQFKQDNGDLGNLNRAYEQARERTLQQIKWLKVNEDKLRMWLKTTLGSQ